MNRERFINMYDSEFINLVTEKGLEDYNLGYTACLLNIALLTETITFQEFKFLTDARQYVVWKENKTWKRS